MSLFYVFFWKNCKYIRFHIIGSALILAGCLSLLAIVLYTTKKSAVIEESEHVYEPKSEELIKNYLSREDDDIICYAPSEQFLDNLMEHVRNELFLTPSNLKAFPTKTEMLFFMEQIKETRSFGIIFETYPTGNSSEEGLKYTLSATHGKVETNELFYNNKEVVGVKFYDDYISTGFFALQYTIDRKFIELQSGEIPYPIEVAPFPRIAMQDIEGYRIMFFGLLLLFFFYILILTTLVVPLVEEKQDGIQAYLAFASSQSYLNVITFYVIRLIIYIIFLAFSMLIAWNFHALGKISLVYVAVLFVCFTLSAMSYAFLVSIFLKSVYISKIGGCLAFFVPTVLFTVGSSIFEKFTVVASGNVFLKGMEIFQIYTNKKREFLFRDVFTRITESSYTLCEIYIILLLQFIIYIALYNYLTNIFPGSGGIRKPFYYIFQAFRKRKSKQESRTSELECGTLNSKIPIKIQNLVKTFKTVKGQTNKAVDDLNMEVSSNKITVLLGHNGAGKTTTINMIVGSIEKTSGSISVFGENNVDNYRNNIGYCPQHNMFMQYLTCKEHLYFFSRLRGLTKLEANLESSTLLSELLLNEKENEVGENLSGGMKRRLALGIAIAGQTAVAILDEPTSGLDPESRRTLWDILLKIRKNRTVLITTHYMEEAEILGDEINIMSRGKLVRSGTALDLKRKHGSGYILKLLTNETFDKSETMELIRKDIPKAAIHYVVEPTFWISLPYTDSLKYPKVLKRLEENMKFLGILCISITNSSLEEVFLNCGGEEEVDTSPNIPYKPIQYEYKRNKTDPTTCAKFVTHQCLAVFYKKFIFIKRNWLYTLLMCLIPFLTIGITFWAMNADTTFSTSHNPLELKVNIPNSEIYVKVSPEFQSFANYLETEIKAVDCVTKLIPPHEKLENALLKIQLDNINHFYDKIFGAIELAMNENNVPTVKILYSGNIIHSSATLLNLVDNVLLKFTSKQNVSITTFNVPVRRSVVISPARLEYYGSLVPIGWFFYILFYVSLPFRENKSGFNKLQNISRPVYWLSYISSDIVLHGFVCCLAYTAHLLFDTRNIYNSFEIFSFTASFVFYGLMYLPLLYLVANSFKSISSLSTSLFLLLILSTIIPIITSGNQKAMETYNIVNSMMMILPDFGLKYQLMVINENYFIERRNELKYKEENTSEVFDLDTYMKSHEKPMKTFTYYFYATFVFATLQLFMMCCWDRIYRRESLLRFFSTKCKKGADPNYIEDTESYTSLREKYDKYPLYVHNLHKTYNGSIKAVDGIDFNVNSGECFGLLGLNGAGKSSTFEMITGNETISCGKVCINGYNIHSNRNLFNSLYGYCPQSDALNGFMTSYEIMKYMALLRGIGFDKVHNNVEWWLAQVDLVKYRNMPCRYYSGGTKRKLITAMALIGDPAVIFLDEPTTGVDPKSRRFLWKCIQDLQKQNKTIVLTSHSMDECENLCNRLTIMADGKIKCIDYIPKLREQYGCEFTITVKMKPNYSENDLRKLNLKLNEYFGCSLREQHDCILTYAVEKKSIKWSDVFSSMENLKNIDLNVFTDYSISETTLEDIFLNMKKQ